MYGSPPQVRGKRLQDATVKIKDRITPAGAGKTILFRQQINITQDHPRRCGENRVSLTTVMVQEGSPPQVRGKPQVLQGIGEVIGITPAGAGKTAYNRMRREDR